MKRLNNSIHLEKHYALGIGFSRLTPAGNIMAMVAEIMNRHHIDKIQTIATFAGLRDELFHKRLAKGLGAQSLFFTVEELEKETPKLANPSKYVYSRIGCHGVCEAAALAAVGPKGLLLVPKIRRLPYTFAIAVSEGNK